MPTPVRVTRAASSRLSCTGPRVLRGYDRDRRLLYDQVRVVTDGEDVGRSVAQLLSEDIVDVVHVRALATQCFTYAVARAS